MSSVWTVECGEYSDYDYRVVGVYTTKAGAEVVAATISGAEVVERELDPALDKINAGLTRHVVSMLYDGTVEYARPETSDHRLDEGVYVWRRSILPGNTDCIVARVWAADVSHAVKITNEHRTRLIALGEFDPPKEPRP